MLKPHEWHPFELAMLLIESGTFRLAIPPPSPLPRDDGRVVAPFQRRIVALPFLFLAGDECSTFLLSGLPAPEFYWDFDGEDEGLKS